MKATASRKAIGAVLLTATMVLSMTAFAQSKDDHLKVNIPFDFYVGARQMPAGTYIVEASTNGTAKMSNNDTHESMVFVTTPIIKKNRQADPRLVFNSYGDAHFLSQVWWGAPVDGLRSIPSKQEREIARVNTPVRLTVIR